MYVLRRATVCVPWADAFRGLRLSLSLRLLSQLLDDLQLKSSNASAVVFRIVLTGGPCGGKCWGRGTPMRMYDGTVKPVELVRGGDQVRPCACRGLALARLSDSPAGD